MIFLENFPQILKNFGIWVDITLHENAIIYRIILFIETISFISKYWQNVDYSMYKGI